MRNLKSLRVYDAALMYADGVKQYLDSAWVPIDLSRQLKRSVRSIGDNIAEGHGYGENKNRLRFFRIARGSAQESINQLRSLVNDGHISEPAFYSLFNRARAIVKMLDGLIQD